MEEPVLTMDSTRLRAEPGGQAQVSVTLRNPGHLVESFRIDVVGLDPTWWQVHPPELNILPGKEEKAVVVLSPPATAHAPDDALPFGVRAVSSLDAQRSVVEEGDLEVGRILDLQPTITPVTSRGRWSGSHTVRYTNWGNSPVHLRLTVHDKDEQLGFRLDPEQISIPVGGSASARLRVRPRNPQLRGAPTHRPFQVIGESSGAAQPPPGTPRSPAARAGVPDAGRPVLDGAIQHLPVLSRSVVVLAGLLVLVIAGLVLAGLRTSSVVGARTADAPPEAPTGFAAQAVAADLIQLRWAPVDRAAGYRVQEVDPAGDAVLEVNEVPGGATAFDAAVEQPLTQACYRVVAVRGDLTGPPSEQQCATSRDGQLPPPTDITATPVATGFAVGWTDSEENSHVVLVDGSPTGSPSPAGISTVTVPVPAGPHCLQVIATKGQTLSSPPSSEVCVESTGPPAPTGPPTVDPSAGGGAGGGGAGGGGGSTAPTTPGGGGQSGTGSGLTGWVAVVGPPYQEQPLAQSTLQRVQGTGATALIVPVTELPRLGFRTGMVVVATGFTDRGQAEQSCVTLRQQLTPLGCQAVDSAG